MARLTIIVGMGGSGKSKLCLEIAKKSNAIAFKDATLTFNDHRRAGHECLGELVARLLGSQQNCVMDEPHLVNSDFRCEFRDFCERFLDVVEQEWIFFESDVVSCIDNVYDDWEKGRRTDIGRFKSLANQIEVYKVPPPDTFPGHQNPRKVYRRPRPKFKDDEVETAISWLKSMAKKC